MLISTWLRRSIVVCVDVMSWAIAVAAVTWLRFDFTLSAGDIAGVLAFALTAIVVQVIAGFISRHYLNRYWLASFEEVVSLAELVIFASAMGVLFTALIYPGYFVSRAVAASAPPVALLLMAAARILWRLIKKVRRHGAADPEPVILIGAGRAAEQLIHQLQVDMASPD